MAWTKPKTDWVSADTINVEDFNRIRNNIEYLMGLAKGYVDKYPLVREQRYDDYPYTEIWNNLENALKELNDAVPVMAIGETKNFTPFSHYIDYQELNRLENLCLKTKELYDTRMIKEKLSFTLGNYGGIRI